METRTILERLGLSGETLEGLGGGRDREAAAGPLTTSVNPTTGEPIATIRTATAEQVERAIGRAHEAF
ncbi:MAG: hypothetical protein H6Q01_853, partial [Acidobacteria bacterium]|nr:hypothetical protein [Acidobacteriota bacterium]